MVNFRYAGILYLTSSIISGISYTSPLPSSTVDRTTPPTKSPTALLLLILNTLHVRLRHTTNLNDPIPDLIAIIALHHDLLRTGPRPTTRDLGDAGPRGELLPPLLCHFFQIETVSFETRDSRDEFALVALDSLDQDLGGGFGFGGAGFEECRFGFFLLRVFFGAFLRVD